MVGQVGFGGVVLGPGDLDVASGTCLAIVQANARMGSASRLTLAQKFADRVEG